MARNGTMVRTSQELIARSRATIDRIRERTQRSKLLVPQSLERIVWTRGLTSEHEAAREAVSTFVGIAQSCGLSATETLALLRDMVHTAQKDAGDTQRGGALEQAVMSWGTAACSNAR